MLLGQCLKLIASLQGVDSSAVLDDDAHGLVDAVCLQAETTMSVL